MCLQHQDEMTDDTLKGDPRKKPMAMSAENTKHAMGNTVVSWNCQQPSGRCTREKYCLARQ